jgi:hypothetical protein
MASGGAMSRPSDELEQKTQGDVPSPESEQFVAGD